MTKEQAWEIKATHAALRKSLGLNKDLEGGGEGGGGGGGGGGGEEEEREGGNVYEQAVSSHPSSKMWEIYWRRLIDEHEGKAEEGDAAAAVEALQVGF